MAYINHISAVVFLAITIALQLADAQTSMFPNMTPECASAIPDLLEKCFTTVRVTPTEECCSSLKSATTTQVTCLCDNYIANPTVMNITKPYSAGITTKCGVFDKYSCDGTSKGGEEKKEEGNSGSHGKDNSTSEGNGGATNKVAALMAIIGLVASLVFVMF